MKERNYMVPSESGLSIWLQDSYHKAKVVAYRVGYLHLHLRTDPQASFNSNPEQVKIKLPRDKETALAWLDELETAIKELRLALMKE